MKFFRRTKKNETKENEKSTGASYVNETILNFITPAGIQVTDTEANVGEQYGKIYTVNTFPERPSYGWLSDICNLEGTSCCMEWRRAEAGFLEKVYNDKYKEVKEEMELTRDQTVKQVKERELADLKSMIDRISVNKEPVGYLNIMLHVQDSSERALASRLKTVSGQVAVVGAGLRNLRFRQKEALECMSPYGLPNSMVADQGARNMPMSTFIGGFPMASAGIYDPNGIYLGKTKNYRLFILDMWKRGHDRINSNWFISGDPGTGKSTTLKSLIVKDWACGTKYIIFDVEREFIELAKHNDIKGDVVDCAGGSDGRINPLQVRRIPRNEEDEPDNDGEYLDEGNGINDLALHLQWLKAFFRLYFSKDPGGEKWTALEKSLIELYAAFGITWSTNAADLKNDQYPVVKDLYRVVIHRRDNAENEREKGIYAELADDLYSMAEGADQFLWNGITTIDPQSDFVVIDTSQLMEMDNNVRRAQFYNLLGWAWNEMSKNRNEKVQLVTEEGYHYMDPDYPEIMKFLRNISKRDRKYEAGLMFVTHEVVDVLDPATKRFGQAILDNSCYKFMMGCDGKNLEETVNLFRLTEQEEAILAARIRGRGLLIAGNVRLEMSLDVREKFLTMFGRGGGR